MEVLKVEQRSTANLIEKAITNFNKLALPKRTRAVAEGRLQLLRERWESYRRIEAQIQVATITAGKSEDLTVREEEFERIEEAFEEAHDFFREKIASFNPHVPPTANSTVLDNSGGEKGPSGLSVNIKLPTIELPKFSGLYTEWTNFKSMFDTMIIQHKSLNDVQRLHYLKTTLSGEAARLLQHYAITEENFQTAWGTLTETYEDKRAIIDAHFKNFLSLPVMSTENAKDLKLLRDRTREALKALDNLECETEKWDPLIVYLTVQKLDPNSAKEWEMQLGATSAYPSFKALTDFLSSRIRALEKIQPNNKPVNRYNAKSKPSSSTPEVRTLSTTTGFSSCSLSDEYHALYKCDQFKNLTLKRRKEIVREKDFCFNCLRPGHRPRSCPSKYSCGLCKKTHHTLLHPDINSTNGESASVTRPVIANPATDVTQPPASIASVSTHQLYHALVQLISELMLCHLLVGPKLQTDITTIITRWRAHRFAYTADTDKMFRQIRVDLRDVDHQRILWRRETDKNVTQYQLLTVTYGTACAPFLANRVLRQLAEDEGDQYPLAKSILKDNFYVDDALFGADTIEAARNTREELTRLLPRGGFHLRKRAANAETLLVDCPRGQNELATEVPFENLNSMAVLGIAWNPNRDAFQSYLNLKIEWDAELPDDLAERWQQYYEQLENLKDVSIPRWTGQSLENKVYELHGFADASSRAYAAVVYLRVLRDLDNAEVSLLIARTKVAPINPVSIPRLELCAAVLLAKSLRKIIEDTGLVYVPVYAWSDSSVTLHWLKKHPSTWKTFIANRVAEVLTLLPGAIWRHVPTKDNPVDCASRDLLPLEAIKHPLWWTGPAWLKKHSTSWPSSRVFPSSTLDLEEKKNSISAHVTQQDETLVWELPESISSWPRLLRITAYCLRFISRARDSSKQKARVTELRVGPIVLLAREIQAASDFWVKTVQGTYFNLELSALRKEREIANSSPLRRLSPFIDQDKILRVGGRLTNAPIAYDAQHHIVLPRHRISELIVRGKGARLTLNTLQQKFWILSDSTLVKRIVRECVKCFRERAARPTQLMGNLTAARVTANSRTFLHTGVDYAGSLTVRTWKGRGHKTVKVYVALFICFATRAVHLELVSDYAASGFLAAFKRFVVRCGIPAAMYSDNGTNFVCADKELRNAIRTMSRDEDLRAQIISDGTEWHFNPPAAPHFGGLWESGVKSVKHHLRRIGGAHTFTFEELTTLFAQIEACLNSRPIGPLSNDPNDLSCLTPGHFLIGGPLLAVPEPSVLNVSENRLSRWQSVHQKVEIFWRRWAAEYLHSVQQRAKWSTSMPEIRVGDLVLLRSELYRPSKWQLGRVLECHPGKDSHVRVLTVRTAQSVYKRPITQLCVLPVRDTASPTMDDGK